MVKPFNEIVLDLVENFCTRIAFASPTCLLLETPSHRQAALALRVLYSQDIKATWQHQGQGYVLRVTS